MFTTASLMLCKSSHKAFANPLMFCQIAEASPVAPLATQSITEPPRSFRPVTHSTASFASAPGMAVILPQTASASPVTPEAMPVTIDVPIESAALPISIGRASSVVLIHSTTPPTACFRPSHAPEKSPLISDEMVLMTP